MTARTSLLPQARTTLQTSTTIQTHARAGKMRRASGSTSIGGSYPRRHRAPSSNGRITVKKRVSSPDTSQMAPPRRHPMMNELCVRMSGSLLLSPSPHPSFTLFTLLIFWPDNCPPQAPEFCISSHLYTFHRLVLFMGGGHRDVAHLCEACIQHRSASCNRYTSAFRFPVPIFSLLVAVLCACAYGSGIPVVSLAPLRAYGGHNHARRTLSL